jgi:hypothetical protein
MLAETQVFFSWPNANEQYFSYGIYIQRNECSHPVCMHSFRRMYMCHTVLGLRWNFIV